MPDVIEWEPITLADPAGEVVWWRGTWPGCGPAYLSVARRGGVFEWAHRSRPGRYYIEAEGEADELAAAQRAAELAAGVTGPDMSATLAGMAEKMSMSERGRVANAALTTEQRRAAGQARAKMLHDPETLARRLGKAWPDLTDDKRRAVRAALREAGIIK